MFPWAAEQCLCVNSLFLTYWPSLWDWAQRGEIKASSAERKQQLGCRNHKRWKLLCFLSMDTYTLCFQCVLLMIKEPFLFGAQGLVSVVSTSQRSLPEPLKTHLRPSPRAPRDWSKQQIGTISQTASSFTSTLICFLASLIFVSLVHLPPLFSFAPAFLFLSFFLFTSCLPFFPHPEARLLFFLLFFLSVSCGQFARGIQALTLRLNGLPL